MAISKITGSALDKDVIMKDVSTADGSSPTLTLQTGDTNIEADDVLGTINFQAPDEGTGTDAILVAAGIAAVSEGDFSASNNATKLSFLTAASELASEKMSLSSGGDLTVNNNLYVSGGNIGLDAGDKIGFSNNSHIDFNVNNSTEFRLESDGDGHFDGDVIAYSTTISDERLKENIQPIEDALSKVSQLNGVTFTYKPDGKESAGLIAQDVEKVLPSAITEKQLPLKQDDGEEYKVLQYDQTIGLLVEAIKELQVLNKELTTKVEELENK